MMGCAAATPRYTELAARVHAQKRSVSPSPLRALRAMGTRHANKSHIQREKPSKPVRAKVSK